MGEGEGEGRREGRAGEGRRDRENDVIRGDVLMAVCVVV